MTHWESTAVALVVAASAVLASALVYRFVQSRPISLNKAAFEVAPRTVEAARICLPLGFLWLVLSAVGIWARAATAAATLETAPETTHGIPLLVSLGQSLPGDALVIAGVFLAIGTFAAPAMFAFADALD